MHLQQNCKSQKDYI